MATIILPTLSDGTLNYTFRAVLGAAVFTLGLRWNERAETWHLSLWDAAGTPLLARRIAVGVPLTARFVDPALPFGELLAVDASNAGQDPGLTELGPTARVQLVFIDAADALALTA